jgi:hypothetical protein
MTRPDDPSDLTRVSSILTSLLAGPALADAVLRGIPFSPQIDSGAAVSRQPAVRRIGFDDVVHAAAAFGYRDFGYVAAADMRDLVHYYRYPAHRALYSGATRLLMKTAGCAWAIRTLFNMSLPVCSPEALCSELCAKVIDFSDPIIVVGRENTAAENMARRHGWLNFHPLELGARSLEDSTVLVESLEFIERLSPFRFCFLALGSPRDEIIAYCLQVRRLARGLAICGAKPRPIQPL